MELVVDDGRLTYAANHLTKDVASIRRCLESYVRIMAEFSEMGISSTTSKAASARLAARAQASAAAAAEAIDGLATITQDHIAELERIDGDLY